MRNKHLLLALAALALGPALAGAATLDQLTATADCNAWSSEVSVTFRTGATAVLLVFSMQLADSTGAELERFDHEEWLAIPASGAAAYPFGGAWQSPLLQPATMTVSAEVYDTRGDSFGMTGDELLVALACATGDGTGGDLPAVACRQASRWWLRHRAEWPVDSLDLGGVTYDAAQLERLLRSPHRGLVGRRLAHQLAVAKLNLANGAADDIGAAVAAADAWLVAHPLETRGRHREPRHAERREALRLLRDLCRWNHGGCGTAGATADGLSLDFGGANAEFSADLADYETAAKSAEEPVSLGSLKAMYR